jgi:hypothetical protein
MVHLSHFWSMVGFALLVSLALACLAQKNTLGRIKYVVWSFALFMMIGVGIAWLLYPFSR